MHERPRFYVFHANTVDVLVFPLLSLTTSAASVLASLHLVAFVGLHFSCSVCSLKFKDRNYMEQHEASVHGGRVSAVQRHFTQVIRVAAMFFPFDSVTVVNPAFDADGCVVESVPVFFQFPEESGNEE